MADEIAFVKHIPESRDCSVGSPTTQDSLILSAVPQPSGMQTSNEYVHGRNTPVLVYHFRWELFFFFAGF